MDASHRTPEATTAESIRICKMNCTCSVYSGVRYTMWAYHPTMVRIDAVYLPTMSQHALEKYDLTSRLQTGLHASPKSYSATQGGTPGAEGVETTLMHTATCLWVPPGLAWTLQQNTTRQQAGTDVAVRSTSNTTSVGSSGSNKSSA